MSVSRNPGIGGIQRSGAARRLRAHVPDALVDGGRRGARAYGTWTSSRRPLPDYLIIGAKKGGTTSVANWLTEHPQVLGMVPRWQSAKSPHYFDINYGRRTEWYLSHFPTAAARRRRAREAGGTTVVGEASPYYLFHPYAAERIAHTAPGIKLIAVLRDPVSRAYSNYWDRVATGAETLQSFEEAIDAEPARLQGLADADLRDPHAYHLDHDHHTYLARGIYAPQVRRYQELFDPSQLLVLSASWLFTDAAGTFKRVQDFLGIDRVELPLSPRNVREGYPPLAPSTRARLEEYYAPHDRELVDLLGPDFDWSR